MVCPCVPIILMLGFGIMPYLGMKGHSPRNMTGTKCRSPRQGFPEHGQSWAVLGGWVEEERAALWTVQLVSCTIAHPQQRSQEKGSPTQLPAPPSTAAAFCTAERKGRVRIWPLAVSTGCLFRLCLGLVQLYPSPSESSSCLHWLCLNPRQQSRAGHIGLP